MDRPVASPFVTLALLGHDTAAIDGAARSWDPHHVLAAIVKVRPDLTTQAVDALRRTGQPNFPDYVAFIAEDAAIGSPRQAIAIVDELERQPDRDMVLRRITTSLATVDPVAASVLVERIVSPRQRAAAIKEIVVPLASHDWVRAEEMLDGLDGLDRVEASVALLKVTARLDPEGACEAAARVEPDHLRDDALRSIALAVEEFDLDLAIRARSQIADLLLRAVAQVETAVAAAKQQRSDLAELLDAASASIANCRPGFQRDAATHYLAVQLATIDESKALAFAETVADQYKRDDAFVRVAVAIASRSWTDALTVLELVTDDPPLSAASSGVAVVGAEVNFERALQFAERIPDTRWRAETLGELAAQIAKSDPARAMEINAAALALIEHIEYPDTFS